MGTIFSYTALSLLLFLLTKLLLSFSSSKNRKKNLPPSPPALPIIGHLHLLKKHLHHTLSHLADRHGPIFLLRFGSRTALVVSSPTLVDECLTKNDIAFADRVHLPSGKQLTYDYTMIGLLNYGTLWRDMRRIASVELFSVQRLQSFSDAREDEVKAMARRLFVEWKEGWARVELKSRLFELSLNVLMTMLTGEKPLGEDGRLFREMVEELSSLLGVSNLGDFVPVLRWMDFLRGEKRLRSLMKYRDEVVQGLIDEQRRKEEKEEGEGKKKKATTISVLLSLQKSEPEYYTDQLIRAFLLASLYSTLSDSSRAHACILTSCLLPEKFQPTPHLVDWN